MRIPKTISIDVNSGISDITTALQGKWSKVGDTNYLYEVIQNLIIVVCNGGNVNVTLPNCYDGFLMGENGEIVLVNDSKLNTNIKCFGILRRKEV